MGELMIAPSVARSLPAMVQGSLASLPAAQQQAFVEEYHRRAKSTFAAYLCWLIGLHYAYVGRWGLLALYWLSAGGLLMWVIIDVFRMPGIVRDYNNDVAVDVARTIKTLGQ